MTTIRVSVRLPGLIEALDRRLHLLKFHAPYDESDHVLNIAYNIATGGSRLEHLELRRNDEVHLDAPGASAERQRADRRREGL